MGAEVKGGLLIHLSNYVRERRGQAAWDALVAGLPEKDRETLGGLVLAGGWYPIGLWNRTLTAYMRAHAEDLDREAEALARYTADHDLNVVFRVFLKTRDPAFMLKRATSFWRRYYTTGDLEPQEVAKRRWHVTLSAPTGEDEGPCELSCNQGACAWLRHAVTLTGSESARVEHLECRFHGHGRCLYEVTW
jgi:hypothetical protein